MCNIQVNHSSLFAEDISNKWNDLSGLDVKNDVSYGFTVTTYVFTATMLPISSSAGITAAAGTRLSLNLLLAASVMRRSFQSPAYCRCWYSSSPFQAMLIRKVFAPAANLSCKRHFSCALSGIKPQFPVIRWSHGYPIHNRLQLIDQRPFLYRTCLYILIKSWLIALT